MITIRLPLPPTGLSPNAPHGAHWGPQYRLKKKYGEVVGYIVKQAVRGTVGLPWDKAVCRITWYTRTPNNRRDADNCIASFKAGLDSLEGWVIVNDSGLVLELADPFFVMAPGKEGYVQLELTEVT